MHFKNIRNYLSISISKTFSVASSIRCPWAVLPCPVCRLPRNLVTTGQNKLRSRDRETHHAKC